MGRPTRDPLDSLRTRLWFSVVLQSSGARSAHSLEQLIEPKPGRETGDGIRRTNKWAHYRDGIRIPTATGGRPSAVDLAECAFSGTARYFRSPIWLILAGWTPNQQESNDLLLKCDARVLSIMSNSRETRTFAGEGLLGFCDEDARLIARLGDFSAYEALVIVLARSDAIASAQLRHSAFDGLRILEDALAVNPILGPFCEELYHEITGRFRCWLFDTSMFREDLLFVPWSLHRAILREGALVRSR